MNFNQASYPRGGDVVDEPTLNPMDLMLVYLIVNGVWYGYD